MRRSQRIYEKNRFTGESWCCSSWGQGKGPAADTLGTAILEYLRSRTESESVRMEVEKARKRLNVSYLIKKAAEIMVVCVRSEVS